MMRVRGRVTAIVATVAVALISFGLPSPAHALPPVTGPAIEAAVNAAKSATLAAGTEWLQASCPSESAGTPTTTKASFGPGAFSLETNVFIPTIMLRFSGTPERLVSPIWFVQHVDSTNLTQVKAKAGVSNKVSYVSSPWTAEAEKFLSGYLPPSYGYLGVRALLKDSLLPTMPDWLSDPAKMGSKVPLPDGANLYSASHQTAATVTEAVEYTVDAMGRLVSWKWSKTESGVTTATQSCTFAGFGVPGPVWKPSKSRVAPVTKIGRAAWQLYWTGFARDLAKDIRAAVAASQANTPASVRGFTYVVLDGKKLLPDWVITNISGGAKYSLTDPVAGTACWSVTAKNGKLSDQACP